MPPESSFRSRSRNPRAWAAACNIGPNPTFGEQIRKVEAHLIGFAGDLYGRSVELDFLARLRSTRAFANLDDLLSQIQALVPHARSRYGPRPCARARRI